MTTYLLVRVIMKITQLRNATLVIEAHEHVILVDPMLAPIGSIPSLKYATKSRCRNPIVDLPDISETLLKKVTHCLITHCQKGHFDHLDGKATKWLREHNIPIFCSLQDHEFLTKKGLRVQALNHTGKNKFLNGSIQLVPCVHGTGLVGKFMAHGYGYVIELPREPSLYLSGDTILTDTVRALIQEQQPEIIVIPAGGAQFDLGGEIIMGIEDALQVAELATGTVIANHLEALDHCPVSRENLKKEIQPYHWATRFLIPDDGETISLN